MTNARIARHIFPSGRTRGGDAKFIYIKFLVAHRLSLLLLKDAAEIIFSCFDAKNSCYNLKT